MANNLEVFVVGAGVVGLTTAIRALEAGYKVTIFAEIFPGDPKSIKYTSCWAGANHVSFEGYGAVMHELDRDTRAIFLDLIEEDPLIPVMTRALLTYAQTLDGDEQKQFDHLSRMYPDFRILEASELPEGVVHGAFYTTICVDVPRYLSYLMSRFLAAGGQAFRTTIASLSSLLSVTDRPALEPFPLGSTNSMPSSPVALINCTGLGALTLGDVLDTNMYPTRGETVLIRAPWVDHSMTYYYKNSDVSYIIPRQSGDVIVGGTFQVDDWHPTSRPETVKSIKERGISVYPELLPPGKRENQNINDLDVVEECVGLRTTRKGGLRLEATLLDFEGKTIPVVHNYGHGGGGYQSSWASANRAIELLHASLGTK
ncbi:D-amino-acid oxidase [Mycena maculata]|uniref:D-amino-acid oxidase n=1 Tax=Mycena maculata TaxID=230809 RepID=A0AAD7IZN1_9AGAR|nr:D-amino-acid oxidase [Mycena maculata]